MKPLAAAINMAPALEHHAFGVFALEHIGGEISIRTIARVALQMGLAATVKLGFLGLDAAIWTG